MPQGKRLSKKNRKALLVLLEEWRRNHAYANAGAIARAAHLDLSQTEAEIKELWVSGKLRHSLVKYACGDWVTEASCYMLVKDG